MKATVDRIEKNKVTLEVEVDTEAFSSAVEQAYKKLVKKVNIPGFRKGKAPRPIVERYIGKEALYEEAVEIVLPNAYMQAVTETGIEPVTQPEVELVQLEEGMPVVFKATVVVKPEVKLGQYVGLELEAPSTEVSEADIDGDLEKLRNRHAKLVTLEEGTVVKGDLVNIDFEGKIDGIPFEGGKAENYSLEIGSASFIPGFEEQIEGMALESTGDINVKFPDDYGKEELAGKDAVFTVTVKLIKRKELAPLDDEFAKDVSEFDTLEELRADLANKLKEAAEANKIASLRNQVVTKSVANAEMEVPAEMVDSRVDEMVKGMERRMMSQGLDLETYLKYTNSNVDEMRERLKPDAETGLKQTLVLDAVAVAEKMAVEDQDIEAEILRMSKEMNQEAEMIRKIMEGQDQLASLKESLLREKAIAFMLEKAVENAAPQSTNS